MSEKIQIGLYAIKEEIKEVVKQTTQTTTIDIAYLTKHLTKEKGFKQQETNLNLSKDFDIYLFFKKTKTPIAWKDFVRVIAKPSSDILANDKNSNESYVILFKNVKNSKIYATTGGYGHTSLQGLVESDFGLEILSRIIKANDKTIRASKERNLTGGILGEIKFFRSNYNLNENENFGNFYQELQSSLNSDLLKKFGFTQNDIDSDRLCIAKNSFTIKKTISFDELIVIIKSCEKLITSVKPVVEINSVKKLGKADQVRVSELEQEIVAACHDEYSGKNPKFEIELCHREFGKYFSATQFIIYYKIHGEKKEITYEQPIKKLTEVVREIKKIDSTLNQEKLYHIIEGAIIESKDSEGNQETIDSLENHFYTEVRHDSKSYFLYERDWYEIKQSFIEKLNIQCSDFIAQNSYKGKLETWNYPKETEDDFNAGHLGKKNTIVLHKVTPQNIEACDILQWDNQNIYFIHVKTGFDNSMRDLTNQVSISAKLINEDRRTGYRFLKSLYEDASNYKGMDGYRKKVKNQFSTLNQQTFLALFESKKLVFVLAVLDKAKKQRSLSDITSFDSNIAKFSLSELIKILRGIDVGVQICDIRGL